MVLYQLDGDVQQRVLPKIDEARTPSAVVREVEALRRPTPYTTGHNGLSLAVDELPPACGGATCRHARRRPGDRGHAALRRCGSGSRRRPVASSRSGSPGEFYGYAVSDRGLHLRTDEWEPWRPRRPVPCCAPSAVVSTRAVALPCWRRSGTHLEDRSLLARPLGAVTDPSKCSQRLVRRSHRGPA